MTSRFAKFMNLKDFHPSNYQNQKKVWMAREKEKQKEKELQQQDREYQKEHSLLTAKALAPAADKNKLALSFMYNEPPGFAEAQEKLVMKTQKKAPIEEKDEQGRRKPIPLEEKFEFLKNAPVQGKYVAEQGNVAHLHKPFGIQIRNVKCSKCGAYGHQKSDRECPRYSELIGDEGDKDIEAPREGFQDPLELMRQMRDNGFAIKRTVLGRQNNMLEDNQQLVLSDDDDAGSQGEELEFLRSLSSKEKKRLLKKLTKMQAGDEAEGAEKRKKSKKSKKAKKRKDSGGSGQDSSGESEMGERRTRKEIKDRGVKSTGGESGRHDTKKPKTAHDDERSHIDGTAGDKGGWERRRDSGRHGSQAAGMNGRHRGTRDRADNEREREVFEGDVPWHRGIRERSKDRDHNASRWARNRSPERHSGHRR